METIKAPDTERICSRCKGVFKFELSDIRVVSGKRIVAHQVVYCPFCNLSINPWNKEETV